MPMGRVVLQTGPTRRLREPAGGQPTVTPASVSDVILAEGLERETRAL
jgi:hypothetical protein